MHEIEAHCREVRRIFERMLVSSGIDGVAGSCLYASMLLVQSLEKFGGCQAWVRGGDGTLNAGARDASGAWHGHYWVEGRSPTGAEFIADITADQFGYDAVAVLPLSQGRSRYIPGDDRVVQYAVEEELALAKWSAGPTASKGMSHDLT